jgi:hypothetical protein
VLGVSGGVSVGCVVGVSDEVPLGCVLGDSVGVGDEFPPPLSWTISKLDAFTKVVASVMPASQVETGFLWGRAEYRLAAELTVEVTGIRLRSTRDKSDAEVVMLR